MSENNEFRYHYAAGDKEPLAASQGTPGEEDGDAQLSPEIRQFKQNLTTPGLIVSLSAGIIGTLVLGGGLSMILRGTKALFYPGVLIGLVGALVVMAAYPLYAAILKNRQKKLDEMLHALDETPKDGKAEKTEENF